MNIKFSTGVVEDTDELVSLLIDTIQSKCLSDYNQEQIDTWSSSARKVEHWDSFVNN